MAQEPGIESQAYDASCVGGIIFASDIMENKKDDPQNEFASRGQNKQVVYYHPKHMNAFIDIIKKVVLEGCSDTFQPQMRGNGAIMGEMLVVRYNTPSTIFERVSIEGNNIIGEYESLSFDSLCIEINNVINKYTPKPKVVCIDLLSIYADKQEPYNINKALNDIAHENDVLVFSGWQIASFTPSNIVQHFIKHHSDLISLIGGEIEEQSYFSIHYGTPETKELIYAIYEEGNVTVPEGVAKRICLERIIPALLEHPLKQIYLKHAMFGAFRGQYAYKTMSGRLSELLNSDMVQQSGDIVSLTKGEATRKPYCQNVAIQGLTDTETYGRRHKKPFMTFRDFKLITNSWRTDAKITKIFAIGLAETIIKSGSKAKPALREFYVMPKHRRLLIVIVANNNFTCNKNYIGQLMQKHSDEAKNTEEWRVEEVEPGTKEIDYIDYLKKSIDTFKPDFVIAMGLERLNYSNMTKEQFFIQMQDVAKRKSSAIIGEYSSNKGEQLNVNMKENIVLLDSFFHDEDYQEINANLDYNFERMYKVDTTTKDFILASMVCSVGISIETATPKTVTRQKLICDFWGFDPETPLKYIQEIMEWDDKRTNYKVRKSEALGIIRIKGKNKDRRITYNPHHPQTI